MSADTSDLTAKTYVECAIQTEKPSTPPPSLLPIPTSHLSPIQPSMPFNDLEGDALTFLSSDSSTEDAYTQSSPLLSTVQSQRFAKPRLERSQPSDTKVSESSRIVSMPETVPGFSIKTEVKQMHRIVSMPDPPPERAPENVADSSLSSDSGNTSSLYSAESSSFASVADVTTDSVLIISHNDDFSEGFLHPDTIKEETSEDNAEKGEIEKTWTSRVRSPPRPIPALHGPLSLPYARCPSGAEGTVIEEPESIPRMIWGLDPDIQLSLHEEVQELSPVQATDKSPEPVASPEPNKPLFAATKRMTVTIRAPPASDSENRPPLPVVTSQETKRNRLDSQDASSTKLPVERSPVGARRSSRQILSEELQQEDSAKRVDSRFYNFSKVPEALPSSKAHDFSQPTTVGNMKVTARPAPGSALPQIFIEPRSPESLLPSRHEIAAIEYKQQYQRGIYNDFLPTPPSSSSSLWSSHFSPYPESLPSPTIPYLTAAEQLRRLVQERLTDVAPLPLAPAAQIDTYPSSYPITDFNELSSPRELLNYLARREVLTTTQAAVAASQRARGFAAQSPGPSVRGKHQTALPQQVYAPLSPVSPDLQLYPPRGYTTHQPRSIPLTRLIQRRLSAVPEEDTAPLTRGRSPSPVLRSFETQGRASRQPSGPGDVAAFSYTGVFARGGDRAKIRPPSNGRVRQDEALERPQRTPLGPRTRVSGPPRAPLGPKVCDDREPDQPPKDAFRKKTPRGGHGTAAANGSGKPARKTYGSSIAGRI